MAKGSVDFFKHLQCGSYKPQSTKTIQGHNKRFGDPDTSVFESLKQKHNRAYLSEDSEESMSVIIKCNIITSYTKYVSISLI